MEQRARDIPRDRMSFTMRCVAVNVFMYSKLSYPMNFLMMGFEIYAAVTDIALRFITLAPCANAQTPIRSGHFFGTKQSLRDLWAANISALLCTACRLQRRGDITADMLNDVHDVTNVVSSTRPLCNFALAYATFDGITGRSVESIVSNNSQVTTLHRMVYNELLKHARFQVRDYLRHRFERRGLQWQRCEYNLRRMSSTVLNAHKVTLVRYLLNGMITTRRRRFWTEAHVACCAICSASSADTALA